MTNKKWLIIAVCAVLAVAFLLGVTDKVNFRSGENVVSSGDSLIGLFITRKYMNGFNIDQYVENNLDKVIAGGEISQDDIMTYGGRVWATLKEKKLPLEDGGVLTELDNVFEGFEGYRIMYPTYSSDGGPYGYINTDDGISNVSTSISATDDSEITKSEGVIYFVPQKDEEEFFFNSVYQTADGRIYAVPGNAIMFTPDNVSGSSMSMRVSGKRSSSENGKLLKEYGVEVSVKVMIVDKMVKVTVLQYGADNNLLKSEEFLPGRLPEEYTPLSETEYIVVDTENESEDPVYAHDRKIFAKSSLFLEAFVCRDDGICTKQHCEILWPGKTSEQ